MKDKIYIIGPKSSGKTTFTHKMMGRDFLMFRDNVIELGNLPESLNDAIQVYLILPEEEEMKTRSGDTIKQDEYDRYMEFYYEHIDSIPITIVKDF